MDKQRTDDPHYGDPSSKQPHQGETEEPDGTGTGPEQDDVNEAGMRPTGSGGSAPPR